MGGSSRPRNPKLHEDVIIFTSKFVMPNFYTMQLKRSARYKEYQKKLEAANEQKNLATGTGANINTTTPAPIVPPVNTKVVKSNVKTTDTSDAINTKQPTQTTYRSNSGVVYIRKSVSNKLHTTKKSTTGLNTIKNTRSYSSLTVDNQPEINVTNISIAETWINDYSLANFINFFGNIFNTLSINIALIVFISYIIQIVIYFTVLTVNSFNIKTISSNNNMYFLSIFYSKIKNYSLTKFYIKYFLNKI